MSVNPTDNPSVEQVQTTDIGVYCIRNTVNGKVYVGSGSYSIKKRWRDHLRGLDSGKHHSARLQHAWNKYGADAFEFLVVEQCLPAECVDREQYWIDEYRASEDEFGYNILPMARSWLGAKHSKKSKEKMKVSNAGRKLSDEARARLSASLKGRAFSAEHKAKLSAAKMGHTFTAEVRAKMSATRTGRTLTPEHCAKISAGLRRPEVVAKISASKKGWKMSDEQRAAISLRQKGRKMPPRSNETRAKISAAGKGRVASDETRAKMSASHRGKKKTPEHIANVVAARRKNRELKMGVICGQ